MKRFFLCVLAIFLISSPVYADFYSSNFNTGTDGWVLWNGSLGPYQPTWTSDPDSDGHYISTNQTSSITYVFEASWNNWQTLYGGTIEFDVKVSLGPNATNVASWRPDTSNIVLLDVPGQGGIGSLNGQLLMINKDFDQWFHCQITILDQNFEDDPLYGKVSQNLANISGLVIVANFLSNSSEIIRIDNVRVNPVPEPATLLLLGAGLIGIAGYGRKLLN